jgi:hypothetical protein
MNIKEAISKAYLEGIIEGGVMQKMNMNFDVEGLSNSMGDQMLEKIEVPTFDEISEKSKEYSKSKNLSNFFFKDEILISEKRWQDGYRQAVKDLLDIDIP